MARRKIPVKSPPAKEPRPEPEGPKTRRSARLAQVSNGVQVKGVKFTQNVNKIGEYVMETIASNKITDESNNPSQSNGVENVENKVSPNQSDSTKTSKNNTSAQNKQTDKNSPYPCIDCGVEFSDLNALAEHELSSHEEKTNLMCQVCQKGFTRKYHLERHLLLTPCSGQPPPAHPCNVCGKVYTRKDNLREHLRVHAGEVTRKKKFKCEQCPKMFHGASLLKIHERTHTGEKPFKCDFCPKAFPSGGALTKHRRIHTGEKPYSCPNCEVRFSLKGTLNRHMRIHTGIRPHKCPYCDKQFIQVGGLKAHMFYHTGKYILSTFHMLLVNFFTIMLQLIV